MIGLLLFLAGLLALRALIRRMSIENPLWGAPRIHGELLKLGLEVAQSSVAKYMVNRRGPQEGAPSLAWRRQYSAEEKIRIVIAH